MYPSSLHDIILDARTNHNRTFSDLVWGHNVSGKEEKLKEIIYDARQDRDFDYISAAEKNGILEKKILVGYKGNALLDAGYVYAPYIPMIKSPMFPEISAEEFVSVQPMSEPHGVSFCVDYETPPVPEVELKLYSKRIVARPRKLKCSWKVEQIADLSIERSLHTEKYFTDLLAAEISREIDKEMLDNMKNELREYRDKIVNQDYYRQMAIKPAPFIPITTGSVLY